MGKFYEANKNSELDVLQKELPKALSAALEDKVNTEDFVQMLGLIMHKTTNRNVSNSHIERVTAILLEKPNVPEIRTGEGKSVADMMTVVAKNMFGRSGNQPSFLQRDIEDFQPFFKGVGLNAGYTVNPIDKLPKLVLKTEQERDIRQTEGRTGRAKDFKSDLQNLKNDSDPQPSSSITPGSSNK